MTTKLIVDSKISRRKHKAQKKYASAGGFPILNPATPFSPKVSRVIDCNVDDVVQEWFARSSGRFAYSDSVRERCPFAEIYIVEEGQQCGHPYAEFKTGIDTLALEEAELHTGLVAVQQYCNHTIIIEFCTSSVPGSKPSERDCEWEVGARDLASARASKLWLNLSERFHKRFSFTKSESSESRGPASGLRKVVSRIRVGVVYRTPVVGGRRKLGTGDNRLHEERGARVEPRGRRELASSGRAIVVELESKSRFG
ncbi:hypothetical protein K438DRAFT_1772978 [Mycena galopus ATCC 62051]|nr:hypothetical protein K438DRAFT_1772978 [Mycena galopus ATCC 62051]